jgi:protein tyrosine/serine phosphatase
MPLMRPALAGLLLPFTLLATGLAACGGGSGSSHTPTPLANVSASPLPSATPSTCAKTSAPAPSSGPFAGPRSNLPPGTPLSQGLTLFSVVAPGILARAGTPDEAGFTWLKTHGWNGVVDLRTTDDTTYTGFVSNHFAGYLWLPIASGLAPTPDQARSFLCFVAKPANQPVFAHDNSGAERISLFIALYRYAVQGWTMDAAVKEQKLYGESLSLEQLTFLQAWSTQYPPGTIP